MDNYISPFDERSRGSEPLAPRSRGLAGRGITLVDISNIGSNRFLDTLDRLFSAAGARTARLVKPTFARPAPGELIARIPIHGDLAIEGLAD